MNKLSCILLVDDDKTTNFVNQMLLEDLNVAQKVLVAENGWHALQIIKQQWSEDDCPQLVLLDINMPDMDGFEFLDAFEELEFSQKQAIIIVMLTTSMNPDDVKRLKNKPIKEILNKPLTEEKVEHLLEEHFRETRG